MVRLGWVISKKQSSVPSDDDKITEATTLLNLENKVKGRITNTYSWRLERKWLLEESIHSEKLRFSNLSKLKFEQGTLIIIANTHLFLLLTNSCF